jgi:hypothetical protein
MAATDFDFIGTRVPEVRYWANGGMNVMRLHFIVAGLIAVGLFASQPDAWAHVGGGGRGGGSWHGGGFHGGRFGRGRFFRGGRFFGPGFAYYGYPWWGWGYPWWGWGYYGGGYYGVGDYGYGGGDYGYDSSSDAPSNSGNAPQFNTTRAVQAALAWRGFYSGRIDGVMGPETRSAIRDFQRQQGLPVTGQIDSETTNALQRRN